MTANLRWKSSMLFLAVACGFLATSPASRSDEPSPTTSDRDVQILVDTINRYFATRWTSDKIQPAPLADDAEFMRRVYLDLAGKIPPVSEVRAFVEDKRADKRQGLVEHLLQAPTYVYHFTNVWRNAWLRETNMAAQDQALQANFEAWLRVRLSENTSYSQMVREIITGANPVPSRRTAPEVVVPVNPGATPTPQAFYQANENKPENLAGSTSRLFLGIRLECAQCHRHPFATWTRNQFWEYAAFFANSNRAAAPQIAIPNTTDVVQAKFLDDSVPKWKPGLNSRVVLSDWMTSPENRYFARAAVNRVWALFFGLGLLEPVDDLSEIDGPHELLDELARQFAAKGFDLKFLIRAIVNSRPYQLTSKVTHPSQVGEQSFARMAVRALSPEQIYDSLVEATGYQAPVLAGRAGIINSPRNQFLARFKNSQERPTEVQTSILQALALMNGEFVDDATSLERSATLTAVSEAPFLDTADRVEALYLATLSRKPREEEVARLVKYVDRGGPTGDARQALADVFWVLLNHSEFLFNH